MTTHATSSNGGDHSPTSANLSGTPRTVRGHTLLTPKTCPCDKQSDTPCNVCDGGLAICATCNKAESELDGICEKPNGHDYPSCGCWVYGNDPADTPCTVCKNWKPAAQYEQEACPGCMVRIYVSDQSCYRCGWKRPVPIAQREPEPVRPIPTAEELDRKLMLFLLVQLISNLSEIQVAAADVMFFGAQDDGDGEPVTKLDVLETKLGDLTALLHYAREHNMFEGQLSPQRMAVQLERIRQTYQQSSGRGLLRLPVWVEKPKE